MDVVIQKEALVNAIQIVQNAVAQKSSLPILSSVLIEAAPDEMKLTATDLDIGICTKFPVISAETAAITLPSKKFFDIVRSLPDNQEITLSIKKNQSVTIKSGKAQFKIIGLPKEDFPSLPLFEEKDSIIIPQQVLKEMINLTDFAVSKDDTRHVLTGTLFIVKGETIEAVATDGRRMAVITKKLSKKTLIDREVVIPLKTIQELKRLLGIDGDVKIQFSENQVLFFFSSSFIISRLIKGEFPDYKKVIPEKSSKVVTVLKDDLLSAARRVSIFTEQDSQAIKMNIQKERMILSKNSPYLGEAREEIKIKYTDDQEMEIGFNPRYFIDVLKNLGDEEIIFEVKDTVKPGVIRRSEYIYVVLPMQLVA